ncbi:MAG TPA: hypothetical protein VG674_10445 [Amycolatopsis sp.]|nr:hypothetical protein [Amycolatopsis sp.]
MRSYWSCSRIVPGQTESDEGRHTRASATAGVSASFAQFTRIVTCAFGPHRASGTLDVILTG